MPLKGTIDNRMNEDKKRMKKDLKDKVYVKYAGRKLRNP